jgi:hypothetical protein
LISAGILCIILTVFIIAFGVSYYFLGTAKIAVKIHHTNGFAATTSVANAVLFNGCATSSNCLSISGKTIDVLLSFVLYATALLIIVGYVAFVVCGGIGMAALPFAMCKVFCLRNKKAISLEDFKLAQKETLKKSTKLLEYGKKINDLTSRFLDIKGRRLMIIYEEIVMEEEKKYLATKKSYEKHGDGFIIPFCCLMLGFVT